MLDFPGRKILLCIHAHTFEHGVPPTIREIQRRCDISTTSLVQHHLNRLENAGYIRRQRGLARTTSLTEAGLERLRYEPDSGEEVRIRRHRIIPPKPAPRPAEVQLLEQLEALFRHHRDGLCDSCGAGAHITGDRFCQTCKEWLRRFAQSTTPAEGLADLARHLAAEVRGLGRARGR